MKTGLKDQILIYPSIHYYLKKVMKKQLMQMEYIKEYSSTMDANQKISKYVPVKSGSDIEVKICAPYFEPSDNIEEEKTRRKKGLIELLKI